MNEFDRELQTMKSEKRMDELALKGHQNMISEQLNGYMGRDMMDVLEGRKVVKLPLLKRIRNKINAFLLSTKIN